MSRILDLVVAATRKSAVDSGLVGQFTQLAQEAREGFGELATKVSGLESRVPQLPTADEFQAAATLGLEPITTAFGELKTEVGNGFSEMNNRVAALAARIDAAESGLGAPAAPEATPEPTVPPPEPPVVDVPPPVEEATPALVEELTAPPAEEVAAALSLEGVTAGEAVETPPPAVEVTTTSILSEGDATRVLEAAANAARGETPPTAPARASLTRPDSTKRVVRMNDPRTPADPPGLTRKAPLEPTQIGRKRDPVVAASLPSPVIDGRTVIKTDEIDPEAAIPKPAPPAKEATPAPAPPRAAEPAATPPPAQPVTETTEPKKGGGILRSLWKGLSGE